MSSAARRRLVPLLALGASLAGFWGVALTRDPGLVQGRAWPRPLAPAEREAALASLDRYQRILADLFATGGVPAMLDEFPATVAVRHRVFRDIGFLRDRDLVEILDRADTALVSAEQTGPATAEVVLRESWNWLLQRASDRSQVLSPLRGFESVFRYVLRFERGRWVVAAWEPVEPAAAAPGGSP